MKSIYTPISNGLKNICVRIYLHLSHAFSFVKEINNQPCQKKGPCLPGAPEKPPSPDSNAKQQHGMASCQKRKITTDEIFSQVVKTEKKEGKF